MTDMISRWECPKCGPLRDTRSGLGEHRVERLGAWCPGVPVERRYIAVEHLKQIGGLAILSLIDLEQDAQAERIRAAINAVTEEKL